ncbi:MAG: STAS domain-containing protein [Propionivibrio sp.]
MAWDVAVDISRQTMSISGELTIFSAQDIHLRLCETLKAVDELSVDLGKVVEIDTAGLQLMLLAKRRPHRVVRFCNHSDEVLRLVDLANIGRTLGDPLVLKAQ